MIEIPCVIFAGGRSSRMGEDKALLPFGGFNTLTQYQYNRLSKIFTKVYISCRDKSKFDFEAEFIEDDKGFTEYAPTAGFVASFKHLDSAPFFALSVDSPFISKNEITKLVESDREDVDATIAKTKNGLQPMCGIYHPSLEQEFKSMLLKSNHKLGFLLKNSKTNFILFEDEKPFLNLNHPHEYKEALKLLNI